MKKLMRIVTLTLILALLATPIAALASSVENARYYGLIQVTNNGTAVTNVSTNFTLSTQNLIDGGYLNSSANNCAIQSSSGADLPFMPSANATLPWALWVPSMGANSVKTDILYTANSTGGIIRYFPAAGGMSRIDSPSMELGDNFTITQSGWWDTDTAGAGRAAVNKLGAIKTYVSGTENVTSAIGIFGDAFGTDDWTDVGAKIAVNTTTKRLEYDSERSAVDTRCFYDLTTVSDTEWTLDFTLRNTSSVDNNGAFAFGLMEFAENTNGVAGDGINVRVLTVTPYVVITAWDEGVETDSGTITIANNTTYYVTLERTSAIATTLSVYSDVVRTTHIAGSPVDFVVPATVVGLRYIQGSNNDNNLGAEKEQVGWVDDVEILGATGVVEVTAAGVESGEHVIETKADQTLFGIGKDTVNADFPPVSDNLVFNAPFWHEELNTSPFITKDVNEHSCTVTGATWTSDGYVFDGNDYISLPAASGLTPATGTFVLWVKFDRGNVNERLYSSSANELAIVHNAANSIILFYDGAEEQNWVVVSTVGNWVHLAFTFQQATTCRGYEDAVEKASSGLSATAPTEALPKIGSHSGGTIDFFVGTIGEFRIYGKRLSLAEIEQDRDATKWKYETSSDEYFHYNLLPAGDVPNNTNDWAFLENNAMPYMEYQTVSVNGTQVQYIDWEYDTTFQDSSAFDNDATPSFRAASSDADVSAELVSFLPIVEAKAPAYVLEEAVPFIEEVPVIVSEFDVVPPAPVGGFPLAGVITAVASATDTPAQLPLVLIAGFVIIGLSLAISGIMRRHGSGTILVKVIVIAALMGIFVAFGNFGVDFWMIVVFLTIGIALSFASRQLGWQ